MKCLETFVTGFFFCLVIDLQSPCWSLTHCTVKYTRVKELPQRPRRKHTMAHPLFRYWCPACIERKAKDRLHKNQEVFKRTQVAEVAFD